jgi:hypothetical protein
MTKLLKRLSVITIPIIAVLLVSGCKKSDDAVTPETQAVTTVVSSTSSGSVTTPSGHGLQVIPGTVPPNQNGATASVTFSVETPVDPPSPLPAGATLRGSFVRMGPMGFAFRWPVHILLPYPDGSDISTLKIIYYDQPNDRWQLIPISEVDQTNKRLGADVLYLGYFAIATISSGMAKTLAPDSDGGFTYTGESGYYYTLTVASVTAWKYAWQAVWWPGIVGSTGSSGTNPGGGPRQPTHFILAQATYSIWISRTQPGTLSTLPKTYTYTVPATGTIAGPVTWSGPLSDGDGWTTLQAPGGGQWVEGSPSNWPTPTATYGTGEFQATLTWSNTSTRSSDVDLHLFGPNNMHVYYPSGSKTSPDGSLQLDRDWRYTVGNAVENIYSLSTMPAGSYSIKVNLYGGPSMTYSVRIIRQGAQVKTFTGTVSTVNSDDDPAKMVTVDEFTHN